jgi:maltose-binding protein MalE
MLFVNPHLVPRAARDAAASWSFRQFEAQARRVRQREEAVTPAAWNAYSAYWLSPFLYAFGKERLVEADGGLRIDDAATRRAVDYLLGLRDAGLLRVTERSAMVSDFAAGRVAMILTGSYSIPHFRRLEIPFRPLPFPVNEATGRAAAPFIDYKGLAITRRSRAPVLSRRLLQFLIAEGVQQRFCAALHKLPARTSSRTAVAEELAYFDALQRSYRQGVTVPGERAYGIYKNTMWKLLRFVFSGKMSTEEVLATGQRIIDTTLEQARSLREETE